MILLSILLSLWTIIIVEISIKDLLTSDISIRAKSSKGSYSHDDT